MAGTGGRRSGFARNARGWRPRSDAQRVGAMGSRRGDDAALSARRSLRELLWFCAACAATHCAPRADRYATCAAILRRHTSPA